MNYYIQGDPSRAKEIKAAFEKLGYEKGNVLHIGDYASERLFFFTVNGKVRSTQKDCGVVHIIKTHPDYQELELPIEPKFKVGDWAIDKYVTDCIFQISKVSDNSYEITEKDGHVTNCLQCDIEDNSRLWTIADAKDGDVLATDGIICIFKKLDKDGYYIISPCIYTVKDGLEVIDDEDDSIGSCGFKPATKEDRELLFRKIKKAGYQWDEKKKMLKKIPRHYDISNFKPFGKVLTRDTENGRWNANLFSYYIGDKDTRIKARFRCVDSLWMQCIPFNDDTKHLLGTTDMPSEEYINW